MRRLGPTGGETLELSCGYVFVPASRRNDEIESGLNISFHVTSKCLPGFDKRKTLRALLGDCLLYTSGFSRCLSVNEVIVSSTHLTP